MEKVIIESNVRFLIEKQFRDGGISIPFPQRDIHFDTTQPLNLRIFQDNSGDLQAKKGADTHE